MQWKIVVLPILCLMAAGCVSTERYEAASTEVENQDEVIASLKKQNETIGIERDDYKRRYESLQTEVERLRRDAAVAGEVTGLRSEIESLREKLASMPEMAPAGDVQLKDHPEGLAFSVAGNVVFDSGSDGLRVGGKAILRKIAEQVRETPHMIRVEGHTDNQPVRKVKAKFPKGNLQLSGARALNVSWFLVKECGIPHGRVSFAGYGEERPVAANGTDEGRRQNRRVEIVILGAK